MGRRVLVAAAHPDDDVLGCGATIARWAQEGRQVVVAPLPDGVGTGRAASGPTPVHHRLSKPSRTDQTRSWASRLPRHLSSSEC